MNVLFGHFLSQKIHYITKTVFSGNGSDVGTPLANCLDGIDPLHQKFSLKANIGASFLLNFFVSLALYRDRRFITPRIIQDDSDSVSNPRYTK